MPNITWGETEKQGSWKWRVLQNPFFSSRWIPKGGIFWWRKERGNIAWAVQTQYSFWCHKFRCKVLGAWEQVGQELLCQMTDKVKKITPHLNFSYHALGKVMTQMFCTFWPRDKKWEQERGKNQNDKDKWIRLQEQHMRSQIFPLMLDGPLWGASTCRSRWETHLYFLKSRKWMERGRSIADRTCILNMTVRWLNRPLWAATTQGSTPSPLWQKRTPSPHATHSTPRAVP